MTDKEMLELAAKAAGVNGHHPNDKDPGLHLASEPSYSQGVWTYWNPFLDDGDALRLAAKLKISIGWTIGNAVWAMYEPSQLAFYESCERPDGSQNESSATRRAIVRAAAEIGRSMK